MSDAGRRFAGKAAFVTGAGAGIGRATAWAFAREGARVAALDIDAARAGETARDASAHGRVTPYACDVADRAEVFAAMRDFVGGDGALHALVNNAVYFHYAPLVDMPEAMVDRMLDVGIKGTFWSTQAATPYLIAAGGGAIINMSSTAATLAIRNAAVYTSIKGAIDAFTRQQAVELAPHGIRVNAVAPGPVETPGASSVIDASGWESRRAKTPLRRLATADDVAAAVLYLASDDALSIGGATLRIDGGITIAGL